MAILIILTKKIPKIVCFLAWASDRATRRLRAATCGSTPATDPHLSWPNKSRAAPPPLATTAPQQHSMAPAPEKPRERDPRRARARSELLLRRYDDGPAGRRLRPAAPPRAAAAPRVPLAPRGGVGRRAGGGEGGGRQGRAGRVRRRGHQARHRGLVLGRHHLLERVPVGRYVLSPPRHFLILIQD